MPTHRRPSPPPGSPPLTRSSVLSGRSSASLFSRSSTGPTPPPGTPGLKRTVRTQQLLAKPDAKRPKPASPPPGFSSQ